MTTLFKMKENRKLPVFPKFKSTDNFRTKFFKFAKYLAKVTEDVDYLQKLSDFTDINVDKYKLMDLESPHIDDNVDYAVRAIVGHRAKISDFSTVQVVYSDNDDTSIAIVPTAPMGTDGCTYVMRRKRSHGTCRFYSVGFLLLASLLERSVGSLIDEKESLFKRNFSSSGWKYRPRTVAKYECALDMIIGVIHNHARNIAFSRENATTIATFRTDKKYQDEELNRNSIFNQLGCFRKVEIDSENQGSEAFDPEEFRLVENDFLAIVNKLPHAKAQPEIKFRRLGKHKATGLYSPSLNILAVDVRHTESMIHEYGHYLDFKHGEGVYSESPDFLPIVTQYQKELGKIVSSVAAHPLASKLEYFFTPTEIFARGFELWVQATIVSESTLLKSKEEYVKDAEHAAFLPFKDAVMDYFNNLFSAEETTNFSVAADKFSQKINKNKKKWVNDTPTVGSEQLSLF